MWVSMVHISENGGNSESFVHYVYLSVGYSSYNYARCTMVSIKRVDRL